MRMSMREYTLSKLELEILLAYLDTGSIPAAAEQLCISTAAANRRLAGLRSRWDLQSTGQVLAVAAYEGLLGDMPAKLKKM